MTDARVNGWSGLAAQWRAEESRPGMNALRHRLEAERRRMMLWVVADVTVTVLAVAAAAYALLLYPGGWTRLLAINVGAMIVATWAFALWNRRGAWRPLGETTEMFLRLARLRCERKLQALRFGTGVLVAQLLVVAGWMLWGPRPSPFPRNDVVVVLPLVVVIAFAMALAWSYRRVRRELSELNDLSNGEDLGQG